MYMSGQIVHDLDTGQPVACGVGGWQGRPARRTTHYVDSNGIFASSDIEEVKRLFSEGRIQPAPIPYTHCVKCLNWFSNHKTDGACWS